ncbi:MAG: SURF1 family protein [Actinomycetes bacterium]
MIRLRQGLVLLLGLAAAAAMVVLGLWQLEVYRVQGADAAAARADAPAQPLTEVAPPTRPVADGYGRTVVVTGEYLPGHAELLPAGAASGSVRVVTALRQTDGSVVAVVRGLADADTVPAPPSGRVTQTGVLLPSDERTESGAAPVRVAALAQRWPGPLVAGYVTLTAVDAQAQGLQPVQVPLPEARGRLRNGAYALQWWVFAGFALVMAVRIARDLELRDGLAAVRDETPSSAT